MHLNRKFNAQTQNYEDVIRPNLIFYPGEKITDYPTLPKDGTLGLHVHIEMWQIRPPTYIFSDQPTPGYAYVKNNANYYYQAVYPINFPDGDVTNVKCESMLRNPDTDHELDAGQEVQWYYYLVHVPTQAQVQSMKNIIINEDPDADIEEGLSQGKYRLVTNDQERWVVYRQPNSPFV
jgi:hypothetical protein